MCGLSQLQEDDRAFANDLVDDEGADHDEEDGAEGEHKMELPSENVVVRLYEEVVSHLVEVLGF